MENIAIDTKWLDELKSKKNYNINILYKSLNDISKTNPSEDLLDNLNKLISDLVNKDYLDDAIDCLSWLSLQSKSREETTDKLKLVFESKKNVLKLIDPAGFTNNIDLDICFNQLKYLCQLKDGTLCYHSTWGFGVISDVDYFYNELEINFDQKKDHSLTFSYALEALELLNNDHILAIKHNNPDLIGEKVKKDPGEIIRLALKSYGNMTIARLMDYLIPSIIPESDWKRFWDAARKKLKNDASIEIPKKRTDLIEIHEDMSYGDSWFEKLSNQNDIDRLFERFKEIIERKIDFSFDVAKKVLSDRLAYIISGSPSSKPEWKAEAFIYARLFDINPSGLDTDVILKDLIENNFVDVLNSLPSRQLDIFITILIENDKDNVIKHIKYVIPLVGYSVLNEIMTSLCNHGLANEVINITSSALAQRKASSSLLLWCQKSSLVLNEWNLISKSDLAFRIQENLEKDLSGILLRSQNQLREKFQQEDWLHDVMSEMGEQQRRDFMRRIYEGHGWESLDRKSIMAKVLRKYPELQDIVTPVNTVSKNKELKITSSRTYRERQAQLEKIMKIDIPENSKEIEIARSYGDLRENAEFKYAKERQALLMSQGSQLAEDLENIKPSEFSNIPINKVTQGTGVKLKMDDGTEVSYYILGMWDQDDNLNIISSETRLAKALLGAKSGEALTLPDGKNATLDEVLPLSKEIKEWIAE